MKCLKFLSFDLPKDGRRLSKIALQIGLDKVPCQRKPISCRDQPAAFPQQDACGCGLVRFFSGCPLSRRDCNPLPVKRCVLLQQHLMLPLQRPHARLQARQPRLGDGRRGTLLLLPLQCRGLRLQQPLRLRSTRPSAQDTPSISRCQLTTPHTCASGSTSCLFCALTSAAALSAAARARRASAASSFSAFICARLSATAAL